MAKSGLARVSRTIPATPEQVFEAWTNVQLAKQWMFADDRDGFVHCEIDPRVGGRCAFGVVRDGELIDHVGTYLAIERPSLIRYSFGIPAETPDEDVVQVDIAPATGGSEVTVTVELHPNWAEYVAPTEKAFGKMLESLEGLFRG